MRLGNPRDVIHDALAIGELTPHRENYGTRIDHSPSSSANNLICDYVEAGRIIKCIDRLERVVQWWLYCAYGPSSNDTVNFASFLGDELFRKYFQQESDKRHPKLRRLARLAVLDYKLRMNNGNPMKNVFIASQIGVIEQHFTTRGWYKQMKESQEELAKLDLIGLEAVMVEVRKLRGSQ